MKNMLFDQALRSHDGDRANLDTLSDYSLLRMENPVVIGFDAALEVTRCRGLLVLQLPSGTERAFDGQRALRANVEYTAQAAADGSGLVYEIAGGERIVTQLASFNMRRVAYGPPPAIDDVQPDGTPSLAVETTRNETPALPTNQASLPPSKDLIRKSSPAAGEGRLPTASDVSSSEGQPDRQVQATNTTETGEAVVRSFYSALGRGNGAAASAHVVARKRLAGAYSPEAMSRFYGSLPKPIRLTGITTASNRTYRVRYYYSAGRSQCNGQAIVSLTSSNGRDFIRSIKALDGC